MDNNSIDNPISKNAPLVSIIVVSYNHSRYLAECLNSFVSQTYRNFELIVADDASADNSVAVINEWLAAKKHFFPVTPIFHTKNTGLAAMLNECTAKCSGNYIKILAADDYLHPEYLAKCVAKMEELGEDYGLIYTNVAGVDDTGKHIPFVDYNKFWENTTKELFRKQTREGNRIAAPSVMMRTSALINTGPYDESLLIEDFERWLKINKLYWIAYIPEKLVYYRQHEANISASKLSRIRAEGLIVKIRHDEEGLACKVINSKVRRFYLDTGKIPAALRKSYNEYPYREKLLNFFIQKKLPAKLYQVLRKTM